MPEMLMEPVSEASEGVESIHNPPLLIGGLSHLQSVRVDWLTVTLPGSDSPGLTADLMACSDLVEEGFGRPGFSKSELRAILGGEVWRRWEPSQPSRKFGAEYESWEAHGAASDSLARWLRGRGQVRPSRVDIAFDFACDEDMTPARFVAACTIDPRVSVDGSGSELEARDKTLYIGSAKGGSERVIRVYRKDRQNLGWAAIIGETLRVEVILKGKRAEQFWQAWEQGEEVGKRAAAGVAFDMTSVQLCDELGELPDLVEPEALTEGQRLFQFIEQHGETLLKYEAAGVDLNALARVRRARRGRKAMRRLTARLRALRAAGVAEVVRLAGELLGGPERVPLGDV